MAKDAPKTGWYRMGSGFLWAAGQFAVCWFVTLDYLGPTISACFSAFFAGWTTAAILGRFAKWGANVWILMVLGVLVGVAVFSGAFTGFTAIASWWHLRKVGDMAIDWEKLQAFLLSWAVAPPAGLGLLTGAYVRMNIPRSKKS